MSSIARIATALALAACCAILAAACGNGGDEPATDEPQRFEVALDFYVNPDHAGIFTALERGHFAAAGLDVATRVPSDPSAPIRQVAAGDVDLAISYEPEVVLAAEQGLPVKAVAALVGRPLTSLIWLPEAEIGGVADLRGKTIATAGISYQTEFLASILARHGLTLDEVEQVDVGLNLLPAVLSGRADAMLGGFLNVEGVDLELRGRDPRVVPVDRLGIPTYDELVLVANAERVAEDPEPLRRFIAALERGTRAARRDPEAATEAVLEAGEGLEPRLTAAEVERTLPLLSGPPGKPFGHMETGEWAAFARFMADRGLVEAAPNASALLTNELLPASLAAR